MINLLPDETRESIRFNKSARTTVNTTAIVLSLIGIAIAVQVTALMVLNDTHDTVNDAIAEKTQSIEGFNTNQSEAIELSKDIDTVKALIDRRANFASLVQKIGSALPIGANLDSLTLGETVFEEFELTLTVDSERLGAVSVENIRNAGFFAGVTLNSLTTGETNEETGEIVNYNATLTTQICKNFEEIEIAKAGSEEEKPECL